MKKITILLVAMIVLTLLASCADWNDRDNVNTTIDTTDRITTNTTNETRDRITTDNDNNSGSVTNGGINGGNYDNTPGIIG